MRALQEVLRVPPRLTAYTCRDVTHFCGLLQLSTADRIVLDAGALEYVDPFGLCLIAATLRELKRQERDVVIRDIPDAQLAYLEQMDFFSNVGIRIRGRPLRAPRGRHTADRMELRQIDQQRDIERVARFLAESTVGRMPGVRDTLQIPDDMTGYTERDRLERPLQYVFAELLENSLTHGKAHYRPDAAAWVACHYDTSKDRIRLAIVDDGCGLRVSLRGHSELTGDSDLAAIEAAVKPRVSCNREVGLRIPGHESINEGIGLTICKDISLASRGVLHIATGAAHAMFHHRDFHRAGEVKSWFGAAVAAELDRQALRALTLHSLFDRYRQAGRIPPVRFEK